MSFIYHSSRKKDRGTSRKRLKSCLFASSARSVSARPRIRAEMLLELVFDVLPVVGIGRRISLAGDIGPFLCVFGINFEKLGGFVVGIGVDGLGRTFGLAPAAIDALVGVKDRKSTRLTSSH